MAGGRTKVAVLGVWAWSVAVGCSKPATNPPERDAASAEQLTPSGRAKGSAWLPPNGPEVASGHPLDGAPTGLPWSMDASPLRLYPFVATGGLGSPREIAFDAGVVRPPAPGEEVWVIGASGPVGRGKVVRRVSIPHAGVLCGAPSMHFVVTLEGESQDRAVVAVGPAGSSTPPPVARGYLYSAPEAPELSPRRASTAVDWNGDGVPDLARTSTRGPCTGVPTAKELPRGPYTPGYESLGEYCTEVWARDGRGQLRVTERVSHGLCTTAH